MGRSVISTTTVKTQQFHPHKVPRGALIAITLVSFPPPSPLATAHACSVSIMLSFRECCMNGLIQNVTFWD